MIMIVAFLYTFTVNWKCVFKKKIINSSHNQFIHPVFIIFIFFYVVPQSALT